MIPLDVPSTIFILPIVLIVVVIAVVVGLAILIVHLLRKKG